MKKLESLRSGKFQLSQEQLLNVRGGKMADDSVSHSFTEYDTKTENGGYTCDTKQTDSCIDW